MKDVTKQISEKATRFLPVDMKDRLKTIFNRTQSPASSAADDDVPDYSAIFNANKAPGQKKVRFNGPLEPPQLAEPPARATMKETGMQRAQDIEDAEIVPEALNEPTVRAEQEEQPAVAMQDEAPAPKQESFAQRAAAKAKALAATAQEAISAATSRKADAVADAEPAVEESFAYRGSPKPQAPAGADAESFAYRAAPKPAAAASTDAESFAYRAAPKKPEAPLSPEAESFAHRVSPRKAEERKPDSHFTSEMWKTHESESKDESSRDDSALESRFGKLSSSEHVRLKVDPRHAEEHRAEEQRAEERRAELQRAEERRRAEEQRKAAEARREEEQRQAAEEKRRAEEQRRAAEARRLDEQRRAADEKRRAEEQALAAEAQRRADEQRQAAEAQRRAEQKRQAEEQATVMASSGYQRSPEPTRPHGETAESKPRTTEEQTAARFASEAKPLEQPRETYRGSGQAAAPRATASERNLPHQQKETSMYAKGQQQESHENGTATVRTEGANLASIAIERNSKFSGQLKFSGAIAIDGQVEGELVAERVVVHEGGTVNATIEGNTVVVAGTVKGDIYARAELEVLPSGVIHGSVTTPSINVRRGGRIDGRCTIGAPRQ